MRMTTCPYCGEEYPLIKSCNCECEHTDDRSRGEKYCEACIAEAIKKMKPLPKNELLPRGSRSVTGPELTSRERRELNKMLKEELN